MKMKLHNMKEQIPLRIEHEWKRVTLILREEYYHQLKGLAHQKKITVRELMDTMIADFLESAHYLEINEGKKP